jgi:hypothetical protein
MRDRVSLLVAKDLDLLGLKEGNDLVYGFIDPRIIGFLQQASGFSASAFPGMK